MPQFRKLPVTIEAEKVSDILSRSWSEQPQWIRDAHDNNVISMLMGRSEELWIVTLEGRMKADRGDWIIKGVKGELYPCKPDIFAATYEDAGHPMTDEAIRAHLDHDAVAKLTGMGEINGEQGPAPSIKQMADSLKRSINRTLEASAHADLSGCGIESIIASLITRAKPAVTDELVERCAIAIHESGGAVIPWEQLQGKEFFAEHIAMCRRHARVALAVMT